MSQALLYKSLIEQINTHAKQFGMVAFPTDTEGEFQTCDKDEPEEFATFKIESVPAELPEGSRSLIKLHGVYDHPILVSPIPSAIFALVYAGG